MFLDVLYHDILVEFEYSVPIINQQGEISGKLKIKLKRIETEQFYSNIDEHEMTPPELNSIDTKRNTIKFRLKIIEATDINFNLNGHVECK